MNPARMSMIVRPEDFLHVAADGSEQVPGSALTLDDSDEGRLFFRLPLRVPAGVTMTAGLLRVILGQATSGSDELRFAAIPRATAWSGAALWAATVLHEEQEGLGERTSGSQLELGLKDTVSAAVAEVGYTPDSYSIFRLRAKDAAALTIKTLDSANALFTEVGGSFTGWTPELDPYTKVARALWALLRSEPTFASLVAVGNRVDFTGDMRRPMKPQVADADLPEVRIVISQSVPSVPNTSDTANDVVRFDIQVASGDMRLQEQHFPIRFAILKALAWNLVRQTTDLLTWRGQSFVSAIRPVTIAEGSDASVFARSVREDGTRGIEAWSSVWSIEADLWFALTELQAVKTG